MEQETLNLIVLVAVILLVIIGVATLVLVARLYNRMAPKGWEDFLRELTGNQERITAAFGELTVSHQQERRLLEHLVNATFSLMEEVNGLKNAKK